MHPTVAVLVENFLPVVVSIVTPILALLGAWALKKLKDKLGIDIAASQQAALLEAVEHGIGAAEQWALNKAKEPGAQRPTGAEKLDKALELALELARKTGLPEKGKEELVKLIEARLGLANLGA